jgi:dCMP deaminase
MNRPSFEEVYMILADIMSKRSTCSRRSVGCVIVSDDFRRVLSVGYNGNASGLPNRCDHPDRSGDCGCIHAEENACISCQEPRSTNKIVFVTVFPCKKCAKLLIQLGGVIRVCYRDEYHDDMAMSILENAGIKVERMKNDKS